MAPAAATAAHSMIARWQDQVRTGHCCCWAAHVHMHTTTCALDSSAPLSQVQCCARSRSCCCCASNAVHLHSAALSAHLLHAAAERQAQLYHAPAICSTLLLLLLLLLVVVANRTRCWRLPLVATSSRSPRALPAAAAVQLSACASHQARQDPQPACDRVLLLLLLVAARLRCQPLLPLRCYLRVYEVRRGMIPNPPATAPCCCW
jgi:hypothetical protein